MIAYIKGMVTYKGEGHVIIECHDIGYKIMVSDKTFLQLKEGESARIYTFLQVKEDDLSLYGFCSMEEQKIFHQLLSVSGIGPRVALNFLSQLTPQEINMAILTEDSKTLSKVAGVGKKTVQRLLLDLKDKVKTEDAITTEFLQETSTEKNKIKLEAIEALTALGYSRSEAVKVLSNIETKGLGVEALLKLALKELSKF